MDATGRQMLVEASWGLGESVVSGRVTPDRYHLERDAGRVVNQAISRKTTQYARGGMQEVPEAKQTAPCLKDDQLRRLAELGRRIEEYYGEPRDVEWAWAEGRLWVLQARPITSAGAYEREQVRLGEIAALRSKADPRGTAWAKYNLAEILPAPTPMTWAIVQRFMSGLGGYGLMLRDLGYDPDPIIDREGFIDLICGRPYINLSREPKLYFRDIPVGHSFAALKANPAKAFYPQPQPDPRLVTARYFFRFPILIWQMLRNQSKLRRGCRNHADHLRHVVFPQFFGEVQTERRSELTRLSTSDLLAKLRHWIKRTLEDFARDSLQPSMYAGYALGQLEQGLRQSLGADRAVEAVRNLLTGIHPDTEADLPAAVEALGAGRIDRDHFLDRFGHRGPGEMELANPRWSEAPDQLSDGSIAKPDFQTQKSQSNRWDALCDEAKLDARKRQSLSEALAYAQTYSGLRETSKHYLMMGFALIRRLLLEIGRRCEIGDGVFYLVPDELPKLIAGDKLHATVKQRRQRRSLALSLEVPPVLFSDDLEAIGRSLPAFGSAEMKGTPLSPGVAEAPALVLTEPTNRPPIAEGFALVCPSTDPAWVPLFLRAKALVMETGGVLSHGAIIAREFGLPAVAGIANVQQRLSTGQRLRVDGNTGTVHVLSGSANS
jgi:pyruvate,water dikinase